MRTSLVMWLLMLLMQAASGDPYVGTWAGTWDGSGTGQFELTLEKKDGAPAGRVDVTTDGGNYSAELKAVVVEGKQITAKYDFPLDTSAEVVMKATFEERSAKGTWSLRPKGQEAELAGGTFTVTRK